MNYSHKKYSTKRKYCQATLQLHTLSDSQRRVSPPNKCSHPSSHWSIVVSIRTVSCVSINISLPMTHDELQELRIIIPRFEKQEGVGALLGFGTAEKHRGIGACPDGTPSEKNSATFRMPNAGYSSSRFPFNILPSCHSERSEQSVPNFQP